MHYTISALNYISKDYIFAILPNNSFTCHQVVAGAVNIIQVFPAEPDQQKRHVSAMWMHEQFNHTDFTNDVSLIKLAEPLEFNEFVQPLPLAPQGDDPAGRYTPGQQHWC